MAVTVSRDLTVQVLHDINATKLMERQQALRAAIQRGEPKSLGVSQVMLGLMVMSYSIPLCYAEITEVVGAAVPWWSGFTFIVAGVIAILLDKHCSMKSLGICLISSVATIAISLVAGVIYIVDLDRNLVAPCGKTMYSTCTDQHYVTKMSRGVKASLLLFTLIQTVISAVLCFILVRQRRSLGQYTSFTTDDASDPTVLIPPTQD